MGLVFSDPDERARGKAARKLQRRNWRQSRRMARAAVRARAALLAMQEAV
jgi:hypothetical protein